MKLLLVFFVVLSSAYVLARLASGLHLMASPGEHRKHAEPTPMVGGIAIFIGIVTGLYISGLRDLSLLPSMTLLCFVGVLDDRFKLPSWLRFAAQALATYLMIKLTGVQLVNLGGLFSGTDLLLHQSSIPFTIFATIGVINAVNMSDGLDGLASSLLILVTLTLIFLGFQPASFAWVVVAATAGFLFWNLRVFRRSARVFMGDAGSTLLGLVIAYFLITASQRPNAVFPPVTALWLLALPLIDAVTVLLMRPIRGYSPFAADRTHYHHVLLRQGLSVNQTLSVILLTQSLLIGVGVLMLQFAVPQHIQLATFLAGFVVYFCYLLKITRK